MHACTFFSHTCISKPYLHLQVYWWILQTYTLCNEILFGVCKLVQIGQEPNISCICMNLKEITSEQERGGGRWKRHTKNFWTRKVPLEFTTSELLNMRVQVHHVLEQVNWPRKYQDSTASRSAQNEIQTCNCDFIKFFKWEGIKLSD